MDVRDNPYTRLVALEQGLREVLNDAGMTMPQTAAAIFFLADVDAVEKCLLAKGRNKDAHDLLQGLKALRDKADESMRGTVVKTMTEADLAKTERDHKEMQKLATDLFDLIGGLKPQIGDPEPSVANPLRILSAGNATIADAQKAVSDTLGIANQALSNGKHSKADCRVESKFPKPDDSLTDVAIEYLKKSFHKLPHAGTAQVNHVIADAVKDGIQRNALEWALVRMQEYGWIKLSIPVWGGTIGNDRHEPKLHAPMQEPKPHRWYFGTQEYNLRLTEYFYNPSYCRTCSKLIGDYDYDRSECHDCRSPQGKLAELDIYIRCQHLYGNHDPEQIPDWPTIRAYLRDRFGPDRTNIQLLEWTTDHLRMLGWDPERWLRMKYGEFIELLKSGLLNERSILNKDDDATSIGMDTLADLAMKQARSLEEVAEREWRNQSTLDRLESAWDSIYVTSPTIGKPIDYARWTDNLIEFAQVAKELGYAELFLKALPASDDERKALSLIQASIRGGENAIRLRLHEIENPSADRGWKFVFNHSSLFWSVVRPKGTGEDDVMAQNGERLESTKKAFKLPLYDENNHIGLVDLSELTKLCTLFLRQDKRQGTLYRDEAGRFIYHEWDYDDKTFGRTCQLMRSAEAYEVGLKADQFFVESVELIAELAQLKLTGPSNQCARPSGAVDQIADTPKHQSSAETDDKLPKKLRKDSPSRVKAKAAHDYAMERIPNAQHMTIAELHAAILADPEVADLVPARADAFGTFLRDAGVKRYKLKS